MPDLPISLCSILRRSGSLARERSEVGHEDFGENGGFARGKYRYVDREDIWTSAKYGTGRDERPLLVLAPKTRQREPANDPPKTFQVCCA